MIFSLLSFKNRHASIGIVQKITFEAMAKAFKSNVIRTQETVFEYRRSDRDFQLKCKDKGGFIAVKVAIIVVIILACYRVI